MQYFARDFLRIYRGWKNLALVRLVYCEICWYVEVYRWKNMCRFGIGWNDFMKDNNFSVGQNLIFTYAGNKIFEVSLV